MNLELLALSNIERLDSYRREARQWAMLKAWRAALHPGAAPRPVSPSFGGSACCSAVPS